MATVAGPDARTFASDAPVGKELEVAVAEMETRLRASILRLIRPTLEQTGATAMRLEELSDKVQRHDELLLMAEKLREEVRTQKEFAQVLQDQFQSREEQARAFEKQALEGLADLRRGEAELEGRCEALQTESRRQSREIERGWEQSKRLQEQQIESSKKLWDGIHTFNKQNQKGRDQLQDLINDLQRQREELLEELYGDDKGLTKLRYDVTKLQKFVEPLPTMELNLQQAIERLDSNERAQEDFRRSCTQSIKAFDEFNEFISARIAKMQADFKTETNILVAHHASVMKEVRYDFQEEIAAAQKVREEILTFQKNTDTFCRELSVELVKESRRIDALHRELVQDIEEIQKKRKRDKGAVDGELRDCRREFSQQQEGAQQLRDAVEYMGRIIGLVLEAERLSSALAVQDFADRGAERWIQFPGDSPRRPLPALGAESLMRKAPKVQEADTGRRASDDSVTIDFRKGIVRGEYMPGQVSFGAAVYERRDMLLLHHTLLQKAHAAFERGPLMSQDFSAPSVLGQPGASGGPAVGAPGHGGKLPNKGYDGDDDAENPRFSPTRHGVQQNGRGSRMRQRPGSQEQPQAGGSRGTPSGPLGETSPSATGPEGPAAPPPLRLPSIGGDAGASTGSHGPEALGGSSRSPRRGHPRGYHTAR